MNSLNPFVLSSFLILLVTLATYERELWPKLECHKWYDKKHQKVFPTANEVCENEHETKLLGLEDHRACILHKLKGIQISHNKTYKFTAYKGMRKILQTIFSGLISASLPSPVNEERKHFVQELVNKSEPCDNYLNVQANVKHLPSNEWGPFYNCVEKAWQCSKMDDNSLKSQAKNDTNLDKLNTTIVFNNSSTILLAGNPKTENSTFNSNSSSTIILAGNSKTENATFNSNISSTIILAGNP